MDRELLTRMIAGHRAAAKRSDENAALPKSAAEALAAGLSLWSLNPGLFDEPKDAVRMREEAATREAWRRLRVRLAGRR